MSESNYIPGPWESTRQLIAAAPDLLEALEFMLSEFGKQDGYTDYSAIDKAEAAIKKAKGFKYE